MAIHCPDSPASGLVIKFCEKLFACCYRLIQFALPFTLYAVIAILWDRDLFWKDVENVILLWALIVMSNHVLTYNLIHIHDYELRKVLQNYATLSLDSRAKRASRKTCIKIFLIVIFCYIIHIIIFLETTHRCGISNVPYLASLMFNTPISIQLAFYYFWSLVLSFPIVLNKEFMQHLSYKAFQIRKANTVYEAEHLFHQLVSTSLKFRDVLTDVDSIYSPLLLQVCMMNIPAASYTMMIALTQDFSISGEILLIGSIHIFMLVMVFMIFVSSVKLSKLVSITFLCIKMRWQFCKWKSIFFSVK